ncbi:MAG: endonuclease/exonuclease/phosphatase family protein [Pseudomonadota bacterium]
MIGVALGLGPVTGAELDRAPGAVRIATFNASLSRKGPGLLLRDILDRDTQVLGAARIIARVAPDIILINEFDHDAESRALIAFQTILAELGANYPHRYAPAPNTGVPTGLDLDGDGRLGGPADAQGFGMFRGQYGMALLSRFPIDAAAARDFSALIWADLPDAQLPMLDGAPYYGADIRARLRLSSKGHWDVPITLPDGRRLHLLASHATPPVFDGPEDRNGRRNADEIRFWTRYLANEMEAITGTAPGPWVAVLGDMNADPADGDGVRSAMRALLESPILQDPRPASVGGQRAATDGHTGDPALDTADWDDPSPGNLRVDYVLPGVAFTVTGSGVFWPAAGTPDADLLTVGKDPVSNHRLVWVDVR